MNSGKLQYLINFAFSSYFPSYNVEANCNPDNHIIAIEIFFATNCLKYDFMNWIKKAGARRTEHKPGTIKQHRND